MKKMILYLFVSAIFLACTTPKSEEDRFVYEEDRIVDTETGDEYTLEDESSYVVTHPDGEQEVVSREEAPFYGTEGLDEYMRQYSDRLAERKEAAMLEHKNQIKAARAERYSEYSDDQLLERFNRLHNENAPYEEQMDVMAELVERGVVGEDDAPGLLEVDAREIDFDISYDPSETAPTYPN
ncbi:hypothetical protein [Anditalea andensis]|uniref:Lipoprotein n=1 Tax=Anditalea andensis TaxID=1048983 RepID=A0A074LF13_9BACT|nr:hypothetical protein [Anditalea andensis]KEO72382.1 hypothetical protein EL17_16685 [Anditalea andensis]